MGLPPATAAVRRAVRHGLADLPPGSLVLVACSGGADSLAVAAATAAEAPRAGWRAGGVTVDHGLQPGAADRAASVATLLRGLGLDPVETLAVTVGRAGGPEAAARAARYAALGEARDRHRAAAVLLGHSRDDQAETVLLGLARGSGARSLAGMAPVDGPAGCWRRPVLDLDRALLRRACAEAGVEPWDDPHNADPAYARVRVRTAALPALEAALGPGVAAALARTARLLRDDADALDAWAARAWVEARAEDAGPDDRPDGWTAPLEVTALGGLPAAVRRRVLRAAALAAGCPGTDLSARHLEELDRLVTGWHGQGPLHLPGGVRAARACGRLTLAREEPPRRPVRH